LAEPVPAALDIGQVLEERIRAIVRDELKAHEPDEWVDQSSVPLSRKTYLRLVREGKLPGRKVGRRVLVRRTDLEAFIEAHQTEPRAANTTGPDDDIDAQLAKLGFVDQ
jgi:excisionase family DNA binding protein